MPPTDEALVVRQEVEIHLAASWADPEKRRDPRAVKSPTEAKLEPVAVTLTDPVAAIFIDSTAVIADESTKRAGRSMERDLVNELTIRPVILDSTVPKLLPDLGVANDDNFAAIDVNESHREQTAAEPIVRTVAEARGATSTERVIETPPVEGMLVRVEESRFVTMESRLG